MSIGLDELEHPVFPGYWPREYVDAHISQSVGLEFITILLPQEKKQQHRNYDEDISYYNKYVPHFKKQYLIY